MGREFFKYIGTIIFYYPFLMSLFWIVGSIVFKFTDEHKDFEVDKYPRISFLIPCYNEENTIKRTIENLESLSYPDYEIVIINDGSSDNTSNVVKKMQKNFKNIKFIDCKENRGKATALQLGIHVVTSEFIICVDSDATIDDNAPYEMIKHFLKSEKVGAVTGNPRVFNRNSLLGKLQLAEYSSIIGAIKRTQSIVGKLMTVSGVIVAYRKSALIDVGLWDKKCITEDIAISWKLQRAGWDIKYCPQAICHMLVPETLSGLWKQRVRWAQGGQETLFANLDLLLKPKKWYMLPVLIEQICSTLWVILWFIYAIYHIFFQNEKSIFVLWIALPAFILAFLNFIQLLVTMINDRKYDKSILKNYLCVAWYPFIYWLFNACAAIRALPISISTSILGGDGKWSSPDRGKNVKVNKVFKILMYYVFNFFVLLYAVLVINFFLPFKNRFNLMLYLIFKIEYSDLVSFGNMTLMIISIMFLVLAFWKFVKSFIKCKVPETDKTLFDLNLIDKNDLYDVINSNLVELEKNPIK